MSCYVLGGESMMERNAPTLRKRFKLDVDGLWEKAKSLAENEKKWLEERRVMTFLEWVKEEPWNAN